jgi:uncharacterized protein (DUF2384 family)
VSPVTPRRESATSINPRADADAALGGPAIRTFERIADRWKLSGGERERVLGLSHSKYHRVKAEPDRAVLLPDTLERISHVFGIFKALQVLFPDAVRANSWIDRPSRRLGGETARSRLTSGRFTDLVDLRRYLDAARGW